MDPNPSSFLPLIFVLHNSTNLSSITTNCHLSFSKLPPTSDRLSYEYPPIGWLGLSLGPPRPRGEPFLPLFTSRITLITYLLLMLPLRVCL